MQFNRSIGPLNLHGDLRAALAGAVLLGLLLNLGLWQLARAAEKSALEARWVERSAIPAVTPEQLTQSGAADLADRAVSWEASFDKTLICCWITACIVDRWGTTLSRWRSRWRGLCRSIWGGYREIRRDGIPRYRICPVGLCP